MTFRGYFSSLQDTTSEPYVKLAAAAPEMCRALLTVEFRAFGIFRICPECHALRGYDHSVEPPCAIDAALTKAGLPDQESRDRARKELLP
jgi:hypothetical protein